MSKPHVRGDGPAGLGSDLAAYAVNPTCVGMDRRARRPRPLLRSKPHVRGDGPVGRGRGARAVNVNLTHIGSRHFYPLSENEDFQCREEDIVEELTGIA